jgi:hypothetical protein
LRSVGTVLAAFAVLNILLLPAHGAVHFQGTDPTSGNDTGSSVPKKSYGRCELTAETPPVLRCGLNPSDDTFVDTFFPDKPFAKALGNPRVPNPILIVQDTTGLQHDVRYGNSSLNYAYVKFNLASVVPQELLAVHAEPRNATLWLYVRWVSPFYNASIRVYRALSNDWDENTLTWNTKPALDKIGYTEASVRADGAWVRWDVSEQVRAAVREGSMISFGVIATEPSWRNVVWFDSNDQKLKGGVSTRPELDLDFFFAAPVLSVRTPYPNLQITIGNRTFQTDSKGLFRAFLAEGRYEIAVPEIIAEGEGARGVFFGWSDNVSEARRIITMDKNVTLEVSYETQYYLIVTSAYGTVNGSGWYVENQEALATASPVTVMGEEFSGVRHVFDHWSQDCTGTQPECRVIMDGPKKVEATYQTQYYLNVTSPYGAVNGSGWYVENQEALATVSPVTVMAEGLSGILGVRHVFDNWSQDCTGTQPECRVIMDGPKKATAVWRDDYTLTVLGAVLLIVAAATLVLLKRKARRGQVVSN